MKFKRGSAFGENGRRLLYVGWWQSRHGVRGNLNGWRFILAVDKLPDYPRETHEVPFFPNRPRDRDRPFEVQ